MADPVITEFRANAGRVTAFADKHLLLLTVTGRRTGRRLTAPLLYLPDGDTLVVFGLNGGAPADPSWVGNLMAAGRAVVEVGGRQIPVVPERATGDDAADLWQRQTALVPEFAGFRARTTRTVPIIRLRPETTEVTAQALLFDMDGTLIDSAESITAAWTAFAHRQGLEPDAVLAGVPGRTGAAIVADHVRDPVRAAAELDRMAKEQEQQVDGIVPVPGADRLLRSLPHSSWAVVTSAPLRVARRRLAMAGLPTPPLLIGAEDVGASKPDPEGFLRAAQVLEVPIKQCLAVEDSPAGIEAAARSGAAVLQVGSAPHPWPVVRAVPDLTHVRAQLMAARQVRLTVGPPR